MAPVEDAGPSTPLLISVRDSMQSQLNDFVNFILRGNVVDLAVAVVIGAAFHDVVTALVDDLITPLIAAIFKKPDFSEFSFTINGAKFKYGTFINKVIGFILVALVIYFLVVKPMQMLMNRYYPKPAGTPTKACTECCESVLPQAKKCKWCGSALTPDPAA